MINNSFIAWRGNKAVMVKKKKNSMVKEKKISRILNFSDNGVPGQKKKPKNKTQQ